MKIETIHEHSFCSELLPERANVLDLGVRGFLFATYFKELGHNVWSVDLETFAYEDWGQDGKYLRVAISDYDGIASIHRTSDKQATRIIKYNPHLPAIRVMTLSSLSKTSLIEFWDLIKIDVEGSEYQIIMSLEKAPAKQLSIEFHLHTGIYGQYEMTLMMDKLKSLGYIPIKHEFTSEHGAGFNYWDSLFILK